jgi:hypothetical protein
VFIFDNSTPLRGLRKGESCALPPVALSGFTGG